MTDARSAGDLSRLGETVGGDIMQYDPTGGRCTKPGCRRIAPVVRMRVPTERVYQLPCRPCAEADEKMDEAAELESKRRKLLALSGRTNRLEGLSLETYREAFPDPAGRDALAVAERWLKTYYDTGAARNLILYGAPGNGKTGLAWSMVRDLCEHGIEAKLVNFKHLLGEMRSCFAQRLPATQAFEVGRVRVLALDDLGSERPTDWARDELLGLVDLRYERGLPTIYVSNYDPDALKLRLGRDDRVIGTRIVSRMIEGATQHRLRADDRRVEVPAA